MMSHKMIFKPCSNCGADLTPGNCNVQTNELGLWLNHPACKGTSLLGAKEIELRANAKAKGDPFKALESEYYQERLKEVKSGH